MEQWFAYPRVRPDYGPSVFLSDVARTIPMWWVGAQKYSK
jgi:hypothetical protein